MDQENRNVGANGIGCQQSPEGHTLCGNNCGFFGSSSTRNLCSKCYRGLLMKEAQASSATAAVEQSFAVGSSMEEEVPLEMERADAFVKQSRAQNCTAGASASASSIEPEAACSSSSSPRPPAENPNPSRCFSCRKRVGLTGFKCRCGNTFCGLHRYAEKHRCSFDFKAAGRETIARANPVIKASKIDKL